jgi:hypothetical protein
MRMFVRMADVGENDGHHADDPFASCALLLAVVAPRGNFHRNVNFGTLLETHFVAILVFQEIFNTDFTIHIIGSLDGNLGVFRFA